MTVNTNKQLVRTAFEALGRSDARPLYDLMRDDFTWIIEGQSRFSRRYEGKATVKRDLLDLTAEEFAAVSSDIEPIIPRYDLYTSKADWLNQKWTEMIAG